MNLPIEASAIVGMFSLVGAAVGFLAGLLAAVGKLYQDVEDFGARVTARTAHTPREKWVRISRTHWLSESGRTALDGELKRRKAGW